MPTNQATFTSASRRQRVESALKQLVRRRQTEGGADLRPDPVAVKDGGQPPTARDGRPVDEWAVAGARMDTGIELRRALLEALWKPYKEGVSLDDESQLLGLNKHLKEELGRLLVWRGEEPPLEVLWGRNEADRLVPRIVLIRNETPEGAVKDIFAELTRHIDVLRHLDVFHQHNPAALAQASKQGLRVPGESAEGRVLEAANR